MKKDILKKAFSRLCTAKTMAELYEENFKQVSKPRFMMRNKITIFYLIRFRERY